MTLWTAEHLSQARARCLAAAPQIATALNDLLGQEVELSPGAAGMWPQQGAGATEDEVWFLWEREGRQCMGRLSGTGLRDGDASEAQQQLDRLAEKLGHLIQPLAGPLERALCLRDGAPAAGLQPNQPTVEFAVTWGETQASLCLVWPQADEASTTAEELESSAPAARVTPTAGYGVRRAIEYQDLEGGLKYLPPYSRSLLRISVPLRVTLAETRLSLKRVLELGPGAIIQFKKSCEDTLSLEAGEQPIAEGEAVKVGDKFGLWITSIAMPSERFFVVKQGGASRRIR